MSVGLSYALASMGTEPPAWRTWMDVGGASLLLLFPIAMALLVPPVAGADPRRWRTRQAWLVAATVVASTGWLGWWAVEGRPPSMHWLWPAYGVTLTLGIQVANRKRVESSTEGGSRPEAGFGPPVRTASLAPRRAEAIGPPGWAWATLAAIAFVATAAAASRLLLGTESSGEQLRAWIGPGMGLLALGEVALFHVVCRRFLPGEPRPMDPGASPELSEQYERLTRSRATACYWLAAGMSLLLGAGGVVVAWAPAEGSGLVGWIGAGLGVAIGLAGGLLGTLSSVRSMRIQDRRIELSRTPA